MLMSPEVEWETDDDILLQPARMCYFFSIDPILQPSMQFHIEAHGARLGRELSKEKKEHCVWCTIHTQSPRSLRGSLVRRASDGV